MNKKDQKYQGCPGTNQNNQNNYERPKTTKNNQY